MTAVTAPASVSLDTERVLPARAFRHPVPTPAPTSPGQFRLAWSLPSLCRVDPSPFTLRTAQLTTPGQLLAVEIKGNGTVKGGGDRDPAGLAGENCPVPTPRTR